MARTSGTSFVVKPFAIGTDEKSKVIPKTRAILAMLEPITFPTAISGA